MTPFGIRPLTLTRPDRSNATQGKPRHEARAKEKAQPSTGQAFDQKHCHDHDDGGSGKRTAV